MERFRPTQTVERVRPTPTVERVRPTPTIERVRPTPAMRLHVAYKYKWTCFQCCEMLKPSFHVDHHVPLCEGGLNHIDNLVPLCGSCHAEKTQWENMMRHMEKKNVSKYFSIITPTIPIPESCVNYIRRKKNSTP